mmetsp:Transcript_18595/g.31702  ORF Transcript_18595/g.31702 Transcript_18595/m.31702 type:complete len:474 (-) Transcript_18595:148-1569(-)
MDMDTSLLFDSLLGSGMEDSLALDPAFCALLHLDWQEDGLDSTMLPSWSLPSLPSLPATAASMTHSSSNSAASTHQTQPSSSPVLLAPTTCRGPSKRNRDLNRRGAAKNLDTAGASIPSPFARTVTTLPAQTPASKPPVAPSHSGNRCARKSVQPSTPSHVEPSTEDTDDSNDDSNDGEDGPTLAAGSRKRSKVAPEIDWRSITDPAERRRQRRLAKNRLTAARSRERKKSQWAELEGRFNAMESDNRELRDMLKSLGAENKHLRAQLDAALAGDSGSKAAAASAGSHRRAGSNVSLGSGKQSKPSPAVWIAILLLAMHSLVPGEQGLAGTATSHLATIAPLLLAACQLMNTNRPSQNLNGGPEGNRSAQSSVEQQEPTPVTVKLEDLSRSSSASWQMPSGELSPSLISLHSVCLSLMLSVWMVFKLAAGRLGKSSTGRLRLAFLAPPTSAYFKASQFCARLGSVASRNLMMC